jgi:hypothetical protein
MKDALGLGISLQRYGAKFFKNNARPGIIIELPANMNLSSPEKVEEFRSLWAGIHEGLDGAHRPALVKNGMKITELGGSNEESQFLQSRTHDLILAADILCCPPHKVGAAISTSYSSIEAENQAFLSDTLDPWLTQFEEQCNAKLLSEGQKLADSHYVEFNRESVIQLDATTKMTLLEKQLTNRIRSEESVRKILNAPAYTDKETWHVQSNVMIDGKNAPEPKEPPAPPAPPPAAEGDQQAPKADPQADPLRSITEGLTRHTLERLINRVKKSPKDVMDHRDVFYQELGAFPHGDVFADGWLTRLKAELDAVLPEQKEAVLSGIDIQKLCEELWQTAL